MNNKVTFLVLIEEKKVIDHKVRIFRSDADG